jgi:hypothetical protein
VFDAASCPSSNQDQNPPECGACETAEKEGDPFYSQISPAPGEKARNEVDLFSKRELLAVEVELLHLLEKLDTKGSSYLAPSTLYRHLRLLQLQSKQVLDLRQHDRL